MLISVAVLYAAHLKLVRPGTAANGLNAFMFERAPHVSDGLQQYIGIGIYAIAELMLLQPMPQTLDRVELRAIGWQRQQRDIVRDRQSRRPVPAGIV